jgi:hypothetical protein
MPMAQALAYCYSRETERDAQIANVLTEARRIAANIAKLSTLLRSPEAHGEPDLTGTPA